MVNNDHFGIGDFYFLFYFEGWVGAWVGRVLMIDIYESDLRHLRESDLIGHKPF